MATTKSIMLTVILAAQGLAEGSLSDNKRNIQLGATVMANMPPQMTRTVQARQASPPAALQTLLFSTAVQLPIATVCPLNGSPESSGAFEPVSLPTVTLSSVTDPVVSASAIMPDGGTTTFASRSRRQAVAVGAQLAAALTLPGGIMAMPLLGGQSDAGQLVVGLDGCQTLFSPTTTAACSTVVSPAGLPPVTITDCDQYVTFSSETLFTCSQTPSYSPLPYSTISASSKTITLGHDTFTTQPFPTDGTSTIGEGSNDETTSKTKSDESTHTDFTSSNDEGSSKDEDKDNDIRRRYLRRQLAFSRSTNTAAITDLNKIAPTSSTKVEKRQATFNSNSSKPALTDLETITLTSSLKIEQRQVIFNHDGNIPMKTDLEITAPTGSPNPQKRQVLFDHKSKHPAVTDLETIAPIPTLGYVRPLMVSEYTTGLPANRTNATDGTFAAVDAATKILPIPPILQAKHNRRHMVLHHHHHPERSELDKEEDSEDDTESPTEPLSDLPIVPLPNPAIFNRTMNTTMALNSINSTISLAKKLALLSPPQATKYYAAPWEDIVKGGVPKHVKGITCYSGLPPSGECTTPDTDGDTERCECDIDNEIWSVTTLSETRVGTTIASFSGPAILTYGSLTTTMEIDFTSTMFTTRTVASASVVRRTLKPGETVDDEPTITIQQTSIPSATISLLPGDAMNMDIGIKAGMPQGAPAILVTSTYDTPTDASATSTPQGAPANTSEPEFSILPYHETTTTSEDGYYGATTTIPYESIRLTSPGIADANLEVTSSTVDVMSVSTPTPTGSGVDDLPTTVIETSIVATETVTVPETSVTMPTNAMSTPTGPQMLP